jgi:hypothetical protein
MRVARAETCEHMASIYKPHTLDRVMQHAMQYARKLQFNKKYIRFVVSYPSNKRKREQMHEERS